MQNFFVIVVVFTAVVANCPGSSSEIRTWASRTGKLASIESFPYHVSLNYNSYIPCSGAIISEEWVLTAATCFIMAPTGKATIRVGSTSRLTDGSEHEVDKIVVHPKRNSTTNLYRYDIALVHVKTRIEFDNTRQPISMFEFGEKRGFNGVISGWGGFPGHSEDRLRSEELTIVPREACDAYYHTNNQVDLQDEVCVVYQVENGENRCTGEYGSPLTIDGRLAGIVSLRIMYCGTEHIYVPTFHTEVAAYRSWIRMVTGI